MQAFFFFFLSFSIVIVISRLFWMSIFTLSKTWQVLGPFPIGTREQDFGADPLENYGNILELNIFIIMGPFFLYVSSL